MAVYPWNSWGWQQIGRRLNLPIKAGKDYFNRLGLLIDKDVQITFRQQGARAGQPRWPAFSPRTLFSLSGKPRKRPGTDGSKSRRYSSTSKLLQASGQFRKSFKILKTTDTRLLYGTRFNIGGKRLAKAIMSGPDRPVLFVTENDKRRYKSLFVSHYREKADV